MIIVKPPSFTRNGCCQISRHLGMNVKLPDNIGLSSNSTTYGVLNTDYHTVELGNRAIPPFLSHQQREAAPPAPDHSVRGVWSQQEDDLLSQAVTRLGPSRWRDVAKFIPTRSPKQCRERWHNRLAPTLRRDPFEPWEDQIIVEKQRELGNHWALIARSLSGRSPGAVKNRWYAGLQGRQGLVMATLPPDPL
jgi:hypothetical protein